MRRRNPRGRPSEAALDAYRRLMADDISRLEKGGIGPDDVPAIDLDSALELDLTLPEIDLTPPPLDLTLPELALDLDTGEEPTS